MTRTVDEIVNGDALTWSLLSEEELRIEHELLRRAYETARRQITALIKFERDRSSLTQHSSGAGHGA